MRLLVVIFLLVAGAITAVPVAWSGNGYRIETRVVPPGFEAEAAFLEAIKLPAEPLDAFNARNAPEWNIETLAQYIPSSGILFTDVNQPGKKRISRESILRSLKKRGGQPFVTFSHLSHIYSIPYKQYSSLEFKRVGETTVVRISSWYKLTFRHSTTGTQLVRCDYLELEGD